MCGIVNALSIVCFSWRDLRGALSNGLCRYGNNVECCWGWSLERGRCRREVYTCIHIASKLKPYNGHRHSNPLELMFSLGGHIVITIRKLFNLFLIFNKTNRKISLNFAPEHRHLCKSV